MTTTLSEGVKVPDVGSVNWAGDLEVNWNLLNGALANLSGNVKTDRDNTWTGEQSFTLPIVGSITGTAAKAIADEDGTSIKTGYVNVAGNQTVTGQKTWSGNQFFTTGVYHRNNSYEIGNTPASNVAIPIYFTDKNNVHTGYVRNVILATGKTQSELLARNKFTNGALDPSGTDVSSTLQVEVQSNGDKTLYFDGAIRNNVLPYTTNSYSLGSSSYQWSSVYAQTYFYNGTAWGLDKDNVWTGGNAFLAGSYNNHTVLANSTLDLSNGNPALSETNQGMILFTDKDKWLGKTYARLQSWTATDQTVTVLGATYRPDANTENDFSVWLSNTSNLKSFHPYGVSEPHLGNAAHKWKTLNGINPGALSLPDYANYVDITSSMSSATLDGTTVIDINDYLPNMTGWLNVVIADTTGDYIFATQGKSGSASGFNTSRSFHAGASAGGYIVLFMPIIAGSWHSLFVKASSLIQVRFYPCLGNV